MAAKPLTVKEKKWLERLEKVLMSCPTERLECYTIGDNNLTFYDKSIYNEHEEKQGYREEKDVCINCDDSGATLGSVFSTFSIVSSSG